MLLCCFVVAGVVFLFFLTFWMFNSIPLAPRVLLCCFVSAPPPPSFLRCFFLPWRDPCVRAIHHEQFGRGHSCPWYVARPPFASAASQIPIPICFVAKPWFIFFLSCGEAPRSLSCSSFVTPHLLRCPHCLYSSQRRNLFLRPFPLVKTQNNPINSSAPSLFL